MTKWRYALAAIAMLGLAAPAAEAQETAQPDAGAKQANDVAVELNKLETVEEGCRVYLVVRNNTGNAFDVFKLDVVFFAPDGIISDRLLVELGPMRVDKTLVQLFDVPGTTCDRIDQILVNDVTSCVQDGQDVPNCIGLVETTSRTDATFIK